MILVSTIFIACENPTVYKGIYDKSQVVLGVRCIADSSIMVSVSKSAFFLDLNEDMSVDDAKLSATINGKSETLNLNDGIYYGSSKLKEGDIIFVKADVPNVGVATAEEIVPNKIVNEMTVKRKPYTGQCDAEYKEDGLSQWVIIDSVFCVSIKLNTSNNVGYYRLSFNVISNYYYYDMYGDSSIVYQMTKNTHFNVPSTTLAAMGLEDINVKKTGIFDDDEGDNRKKDFLFTDEYLRDKDVPLELEFMMESPSLDFERNGDFWWGIKRNVDYVVTVKLETMTEGMYNYIKSSKKYLDTEYNLFTEPVSIYSNISGGIGIISACSVQDTVFNTSYYFKEKE